MSSYVQPNMKTFRAEADLSVKQYCFVKFGSTSDKVVACGDAEKAIGVLMNADVKSGDYAEIALFGGGALLKIADVVALGASIASDANGNGVPGALGEWSPAIAMESGVAGDIIGVILDAHRS